MEYRAIWLIFLAGMSVMGGAVGLAPNKVIKLLWQTRTAPPADWGVLVFRIIGGFVAITAMAEFISVIMRARLL